MPRCSKCGETKKGHEFAKSSKGKWQRYCRVCKREYVKANRARVNEGARRRYGFRSSSDALAAAAEKFKLSEIYYAIKKFGCCSACSSGANVGVYFVSGGQENNSPENAVLLCRYCAARISTARDPKKPVTPFF